jgi:hypothetical protein
MLLAVFAGITMFGFWGIIIGPVLMIVIVTTISVYLAVYKGVPLDDPDDVDEPKKPGRLRVLLARVRKRIGVQDAKAREEAAQEDSAKPPSADP